MAGIDVVHVPYKGGTAALTDVISGQVAYYFCSLPSSLPLAQAGKLHALAVTSLKRSPAAPDVPTIVESGYRDFETLAWYGLLVPVGTSRDIIAKLNAETMIMLGAPEVKEHLAQEGTEPHGTTLSELDKADRSGSC